MSTDPLAWCGEELERLDAAGLRRRPVALSSAQGPDVVLGDRRVLLLCSNNYLGLAADPRVTGAAAAAVRRWGAGAGASRLVSGTTRLHRELELAIAGHEGCEDAVLFSSGYLANAGTIAALAGEGDAVFSDELNHASIIDGCRLSRAATAVFRHRDAADLERLVAATPARRRLVVTDTVFSMDGDLAPLAELARVCERHSAMLMVDEAHATGLLGPAGAGAVEAAGLAGRVHVVMGTLSKALGSTGGYVAGRRELVEFLRNRARTYVFDTAPPAAAVGAALEALRILRAEPERRLRALAVARRLSEGIAALGYRTGAPAAAVFPVMVGDSADAMALSARLLEQGVLVPAIRPPSVPPGTARLRVTAMATHAGEHVEWALDAFARARGRSRGAAPRARPAPGPGIDPRVLRAGGVFVTGTGTGVGKTVATAAICRCLSAAGIRVGAMKPVQTGAGDGGGDASFVAAAAGLPPGLAVSPCRLPDPLAPSVAARLAGASIDIVHIVQAFGELRARTGAVVVEGAGGLLVPVTDEVTMAELAGTLGLPLVVVAPPSLGTLNATALTVEAARARGLEVLGVVLCRFPDEPGLAESTNPAEIERLAGTAILGVVPELPGLDVDRGVHAFPADVRPWLAPAVGGSFDRQAFLAGLGQRRRERARA